MRPADFIEKKGQNYEISFVGHFLPKANLFLSNILETKYRDWIKNGNAVDWFIHWIGYWEGHIDGSVINNPSYW